MKTIKHIRGREVQRGGETHEGWLPRGAALPPPTPMQTVAVDLQILSEGGSSFVLEWNGPAPEWRGDTWHFTLEDAMAQAASSFGIRIEEWQDGAPPSTLD
jgi:hypothetical protein